MINKKITGVLRSLLCMAAMIGGSTATSYAQAPPSPPGDILVDSGDAITGWTSHNTLSRDTQIKVLGSASVKSVGSGRDRFRKVLPATLDVSKMHYLTFWYYIDRPESITTGTDSGQIELTSSGTFDNQEWSWSVAGLHLQRGWNYVVLDLPGRSTSSTVMDPARVNYLRIYHRPTAVLTTRIDEILFTNREPSSFAFARFLEQKRIARSTSNVEQFDDILAFLGPPSPGRADRARYCRRLQIEQTHREINAVTWRSLGVSQAALDSEMQDKRLIKELVCGERVMARAELLTRLASRAGTEVAVIGEIASLFGLTMEAAAESHQRLLAVDLDRIRQSCGTDVDEVDAYINSGALPPSIFQGINVLVPHCIGAPSGIGGALGLPPNAVSDRRAAYRQCMASFTSQASQCDNPYANSNEEYNRKIDRIYKNDRPKADDAKAQMRALLDMVKLTTEQARLIVDPTRPDTNHPRGAELVILHETYDRNHGSVTMAENLIGSIGGPPLRGETAQEHATRLEHQSADRDRLHDEKRVYQNKREEARDAICLITPRAVMCNTGIPQVSTPKQPSTPAARCANMNLDGQNVWFDRASTTGGPVGQINEVDRIEHCMCELFDRSYGATMPGSPGASVGNCPTPEERIAQKCLENPYSFDGPIDPGSGGGNGGRVRPECMHLMQPISVDREALGAKLCEKILPQCGRTAYQKADLSCGCGTIATNGNVVFPGCPNGIPNCPDGMVPAAGISCGCQPGLSGGNACATGGKDFYLARDLLNDLKVRVFPDRPNLTDVTLLVAKPGGVTRFVTAGSKRSQLFDDRVLNIDAAMLGATNDGSGRIQVSCINPSLGAANRVLENFSTAGMTVGALNRLTITLDGADRAACYGTNPNSLVHFEVLTDTKASQPIGFTDILEDLGNIKPPCVQFPPVPAPGPRPLNAWPARWTYSDGISSATNFNGVGPMPTPAPPPVFTVCMQDGVPVPCPR